MTLPHVPVHKAPLVHDLAVAAGVFIATFGTGLADAVNGGTAALVALAGAAVSAAVKALARRVLPGVVDPPQ